MKCLYLNSYIYPYLTDNYFLVYNCLDFIGKIFKISNKTTQSIIENLITPNNGYSVILSSSVQGNSDLLSIVDYLEKSFAGGLIEISQNKPKPFLFPAISNIPKFEADTANISHVIVAVNSSINSTNYPIQDQVPIAYEGIQETELDFNCFLKLFSILSDQLEVDIIGGNVKSYLDKYPVLDILLKSKHYVRIFERVGQTVLVYRVNDSKELVYIGKYNFVESFESMVIKEHSIDTFTDSTPVNIYLPLLRDNNEDFVGNILSFKKSKILKSQYSIKSIYNNIFFNSESYGKLFVSPDGYVFDNFINPPLGHVLDGHMLIKNISKNSSWFFTRRKTNCKNCVFCNLCPPVSNYEILLKKHFCE